MSSAGTYTAWIEVMDPFLVAGSPRTDVGRRSHAGMCWFITRLHLVSGLLTS